MKTVFQLLLIFVFSSALLAEEEQMPAALDERTWTNEDGSSIFKGKVTKYDGTNVTIIPTGKKPITSPVDKFSQTDKEWLEENKDKIGKAASPDTDKTNANTVGTALSKLKQINRAKLNANAKYYFILFSASWCPPCRAEAPKIVDEYKNVFSKNPDLELVLFSRDRDKKSALDWAKEEKMKFPIYFDSEKYNSVPGIESPGGIPHLFIVDGDGKLITRGHPGTLLKDYKEHIKPKENQPRNKAG